jgi:hypothetical protein
VQTAVNSPTLLADCKQEMHSSPEAGHRAMQLLKCNMSAKVFQIENSARLYGPSALANCDSNPTMNSSAV